MCCVLERQTISEYLQTLSKCCKTRVLCKRLLNDFIDLFKDNFSLLAYPLLSLPVSALRCDVGLAYAASSKYSSSGLMKDLLTARGSKADASIMRVLRCCTSLYFYSCYIEILIILVYYIYHITMCLISFSIGYLVLDKPVSIEVLSSY